MAMQILQQLLSWMNNFSRQDAEEQSESNLYVVSQVSIQVDSLTEKLL